MHQEFVALVYSPNPQESYTAFLKKWNNTQPRCVRYVQKKWGTTMDKWVIGLQDVPIQRVHTNKFIESWHRNLKYHFLNRPARLQPDKLLHTLVFDVVPDFQQTVLATQLGYQGQAMTRFQGIAKEEADSYSDNNLNDLGVNLWSISNDQVSRIQM